MVMGLVGGARTVEQSAPISTLCVTFLWRWLPEALKLSPGPQLCPGAAPGAPHPPILQPLAPQHSTHPALWGQA